MITGTASAGNCDQGAGERGVQEERLGSRNCAVYPDNGARRGTRRDILRKPCSLCDTLGKVGAEGMYSQAMSVILIGYHRQFR